MILGTAHRSIARRGGRIKMEINCKLFRCIDEEDIVDRSSSTPGKIQIDDIPSPDRSVYRGDTYGAYPCQQLKRLAPAKAVLNADNWVYFGQVSSPKLASHY